MESPLVVLSQVVRILDQQGIPYVLVGSLAGSMHGMHSSVTDIDLLADIKPEHVHPLLDALNQSFRVDEEQTVQQAVEQRGSFNATSLDSALKVDIFIPKRDDFARKQLERRQSRKIAPDSDQLVSVATAEDLILAKLRSFRDRKASIAHLSDILSILGQTDFDLEFEYLSEWSERLGVRDLLDRALTSARDRISDRDKP